MKNCHVHEIPWKKFLSNKSSHIQCQRYVNFFHKTSFLVLENSFSFLLGLLVATHTRSGIHKFIHVLENVISSRKLDTFWEILETSFVCFSPHALRRSATTTLVVNLLCLDLLNESTNILTRTAYQQTHYL